MPMHPHLARIDIFPIKSLAGVSVAQATILESGALAGDRTYALMDAQHRFINGKRTAAIHRLWASFSGDGATLTCTLANQPSPRTFHLLLQRAELETWLSDYFQQPVTLATNSTTGFPDDTAAAGPTVISTATLEAVATWYPNLSVEELRRRFRTNLEIGGVPAFWEDQLFSADGQPVKFTLGDVVFEGINPCQRCIVPTRDTATGEATPGFQTVFLQQRAATLPPWTPAARFNHYFRLAVNTHSQGQGGKVLQVGDRVELRP